MLQPAYVSMVVRRKKSSATWTLGFSGEFDGALSEMDMYSARLLVMPLASLRIVG
jgi:hypothetical protein